MEFKINHIHQGPHGRNGQRVVTLGSLSRQIWLESLEKRKERLFFEYADSNVYQ